jgi:hypothetical protein
MGYLQAAGHSNFRSKATSTVGANAVGLSVYVDSKAQKVPGIT